MRKARSVDKVPFLAPDVVTKMIPAPTEGWDAISPLAGMDPKRAPILDNWVSRPGYVELRGGYAPFAHTLGILPVETLMVYRSPTGEQMFAASGTEIFEVTTGGGGVVVQSGLNSARWQYTNFTPSGGTNVIQLVNGVDQLRQYNGTVWTTPVITGLPGGTTAGIIHINSQKRRLWYIMNNSSVAAFMPTDAISGAIAGTLDFGALWSKGGYLVAMSSWTLDGGSGPQDYAVFLSSRGQFTIYTGVDPTSSSDWRLVGTFDMAPPIGRRCMLRVGSDIGVITQDGVIPISQALPFDPSADRSVAITARIQNAMSTAAMVAQDHFGWQLLSFPTQQLAILNVPINGSNAGQMQFVMNALTGGWCRFIGWEANCFEIFNDKCYWGGNSGAINRAYSGSADLVSAIAADMQCAYNWLDDPGRTKRMTMIQPLMTMGGSITPSISIDTDFLASTASVPVTSLSGGALWDSAIWDTSVWPAQSITFSSWLSVTAIGHAMAIRMRVNINPYSDPASMGLFDFSHFDAAVFDGAVSDTLPILQVNAFNSIAELGGAI